MPLYEYECKDCKARTEVLQKLNAAPLTTCETCGGELRKLLSSPAIQFKGSGFYINDYKKSGNGSSSSSAKTESKSESKTEAKSGSSSND